MLVNKKFNNIFAIALFTLVFVFPILHTVWAQENEEEQEFAVEFDPEPGDGLVDFGMIWPTHQATRIITIDCTSDCQKLEEQRLEIDAPYSAIFMKNNRFGTDGYIEITYSPTSPGYHVATLKFDYTASDGVDEEVDSLQWDVVGKAMSRDRP